MDFAIWSQILLELTLSFSGEQELEKLIKQASSAFLKKLDCAQVSVLQHKNKHLETVHALPRVILNDPTYHALTREIEDRFRHGKNHGVLTVQRDLYYYGFPLKRFGLLLLGRSNPVDEMVLHELQRITEILAQNCFTAFDTAMKRRAIRAELERERAHAYEKIQTEKKWLEVLFKNSTDAIMRIDANYNIEKINNGFFKLFGYTRTDLIGQDTAPVTPVGFHIDDLITDRRQRMEGTCHTKEGVPVRVQIRCLPIVIKGVFLGAYVIYTDITAQKNYEEHLKYLSLHDPLTGLYNRRFIEKEVKRSGSARTLPTTVIMGDVNGLKLINDVFGHQAGDELLIDAAKAIKDCCRKTDIVARYGGDEFLALLPATTERAAQNIIRRIKTRCAAESVQDLQLSISLGHAVKTKAGKSLRQTIREAEESMYRRKLLEGKSHRNVIIKTMMSTLYEKSRETKAHSERLRTHCISMGRELNLSHKELDDLALLAMLHDIGKVNISERILKKPGPLTPEEFEEIKEHPAVGYRIVKNAPELSAVADYILAHHERWDGTGYPRGLKGEAIPLPSRILAVADAFDAMTHGRIYQSAISVPEALEELKTNAGTQFDPVITDLFVRMVEDAGKNYHPEIKNPGFARHLI